MCSKLLKLDNTVFCSAKQGDLIAFGLELEVIFFDFSEIIEGKEIAKMGFDDLVISVAISPCGTLVAAGLYSGLMEMRSLLDAEFKRVFQGHAELVRRMLFSLCGSLLISGSSDTTVKIWNSVTGVCLATVACGGWVRGLALLPGGREVLAGAFMSMLLVIGMDGVKKRDVQIEGGQVMTALACAGDAVVVGFSTGRLQLREAARLDHVIWSAQIHKGWIRDVCVSPSGAEIATASNDGTLAVVSFATGEILRVLRGHTNYVATALFVPDGSKVITGSDDNTVRVWHLYPEQHKRIVVLSIGLTFGSAKVPVETLSPLVSELKRMMFNP